MYVAIIDDDIKMADLLKTALQMAFYEKAKFLAKGKLQVTEFLDVIKLKYNQEAFEYLNNHTVFIDLIFLDINTSGGQNLKFIRQCHESYKERFGEIIAITHREDKRGIKKGLAAGASDYILKPFAPDDLKLHIFNVWQKHMLKNRAGDKNDA